MFSAIAGSQIEVDNDAPSGKGDRHPVHAAAKIVRDARFIRIVQEVAVDHAERDADGCEGNQLGQETPHALPHCQSVVRSLRRRLRHQGSVNWHAGCAVVSQFRARLRPA